MFEKSAGLASRDRNPTAYDRHIEFARQINVRLESIVERLESKCCEMLGVPIPGSPGAEVEPNSSGLIAQLDLELERVRQNLSRLESVVEVVTTL